MKTLTLLLLFSVACLSAQPTAGQYQSILELVQSGEIDTAKIKLEAYLEIFPDDAQLKSMAVQLAEATSKKQVATVEAPEPAPKSTLSGEDRLEIDTVIAAAQNLAKLSSGATRKAKAVEILDRPIPESSNASKEWLPFWLARAVMALEADDLAEGWKAGQMLKTSGALDSSEALIRKVMTQLNMKGWLEEDLAVIQTKAERKKWEPWLGNWSVEAKTTYSNLRDSLAACTGYFEKYETVSIRWLEGAPSFSIRVKHDQLNSCRGNSGRHYLYQVEQSGLTPGQMNSQFNGGQDGTAKSQTWNLEMKLSDDGNKLFVSYDSRYNNEATKSITESYLLSADRTQIHPLGQASGNRIEDFAKYGGKLFYEKNHGTLIEPIVVAYQKQ